MNEKGLVLVG